jgi:hypothetical protein
MSVESIQAEIAAVTQTADAPLQGGSSTESQPVATPTQTADLSGGDATPAEGTDDEFSLDLDAEPDQAQAEAQPADGNPEEQQQTGETPDADSEVGKLLATPRGKRIYAEFKKAQTLSQPEEVGGIGHVPSVDQTREYYQSHVDRQAMEHFFDSGEPDKERQFVNYWFSQDRAGSAAVAAQLAEVLPQVNPQAYREIARPAINRFVDAMYRQASGETDAELREALLNGAKVAEWYFTGGKQGGRFRDSADAQPQQSNRPSPELIELQRLKAQMSQQQQAQTAQAWGNFSERVSSEQNRMIEFDVDKALEPIKASAPNKLVYDSIRDKFIRDVTAEAEKNHDGMRLLKLRMEQAKRTMSDADVKELARQKRQLVANVILAKRGQYVSAANVQLKTASDEKHAKLQRTQSMKVPDANAQPVRRDISAAIGNKQPGESQSQYMQRVVQQALNPA